MTQVIQNFNSNFIKNDCEDEETSKAVEKLRDLCRQETIKNPVLYDPRDLRIVDAGDVSMLSYLESNGWKVLDAFESMKGHSRWRKEKDLASFKVTSFPRELHLHGLFHPYGYDKLGHPLLYIRLSVSTGPKELHDMVINHFIWVAEFMRDKVIESDKRLALIYDCRSPNFEMGVIKEILTIYTTKYPLSLAWIAFIEMSSSFRFMFQVIKYFFPKYIRNQMMSIDRSTLRTMVDEDNIPTYLDGNNNGLEPEMLEKCPTFVEYAEANGYSKEAIQKGLKHFGQFT